MLLNKQKADFSRYYYIERTYPTSISYYIDERSFSTAKAVELPLLEA